MAAACTCPPPSIVLKKPQQISDLHASPGFIGAAV
jgi:hypothetical protein